MNPIRRALWLFGLLAVLAGPLAADPAHSPTLPDPAMTPGDVLSACQKITCTSFMWTEGWCNSIHRESLPSQF